MQTNQWKVRRASVLPRVLPGLGVAVFCQIQARPLHAPKMVRRRFEQPRIGVGARTAAAVPPVVPQVGVDSVHHVVVGAQTRA